MQANTKELDDPKHDIRLVQKYLKYVTLIHNVFNIFKVFRQADFFFCNEMGKYSSCIDSSKILVESYVLFLIHSETILYNVL